MKRNITIAIMTIIKRDIEMSQGLDSCEDFFPSYTVCCSRDVPIQISRIVKLWS